MQNKISINISAVLNAEYLPTRSKNTIDNVRLSFNRTKNQISSQIMNCGNMQNTFNSISTQMLQITENIGKIRSVANESANRYYQADKRMEENVKKIK
ncbi:MAG: hypothetical protein IJK60_04290 [Clostridia bacterium]|nr:hypothetical protein [Clostridia bacterium]